MSVEVLDNQLCQLRAPCRVSQSKHSGTGLRASENIKEGNTLFTELPLVAGQYSWGIIYGFEACHHCLKSLESPLSMLRRLANDNTLDLPITNPAPSHQPSLHRFCLDCHIPFCSEECSSIATEQYHKPICTKGDPEHPLTKLDTIWREMHFPPETTSLVMITKIIGAVITSGQIPAMFQNFCSSVESRGNTHKVLRPEFIGQLEQLRDGLLQLFGSHPLVQQLLTQENFITLIALIGMNGQGIGTSAFADYCNSVENLPLTDGDKDILEQRLDMLSEKIDQFSGIFTEVQGTGLYQLQSKLNHSCSPNVQILFETGTSRLSVVSKRDILEGEELFISYLSCCQLDSSRHTRRKFLLENYLFECECAKCTEQRNDPDITSDEEDDMDES